MTPRLLILIAIITFLLALFLVTETAADNPVSGTSSEQVVSWGRSAPPYVIEASMFTTTTTARARTAPNVRSASVGPAVIAESSIRGFPCGGDLYPPCWVIRRESGGSFTAYNPTGCGGRSCGGRAQWDPVTWMPGCTVSKYRAGACTPYMGYRFAQDAPPEVQMQREREVWNHGAGHAHWGV